jgi:hypothetical protein
MFNPEWKRKSTALYILLYGGVAGKATFPRSCFQYSSGSKIVVADLFASVMTQIFTPVVSV